LLKLSQDRILLEASYQVLIFDDDVALAEMLREFLILTCDANVTLVHQEDEFWPQIRGCDYDILFLDYQLPTITGLEVLEKLANQACTVPTVMMTGQGSEKIAASAIQKGAIDYLIKGDFNFSLTALPALIQKAVQMRRLQQAVRASEAKIHYQAMLLENVRDALVVWDLAGKITFWNGPAESMYGRTSAEMVGKAAPQAYFPFFKPAIELPANWISQAGKIVAERSCAPGVGQILWISSQISPIYDASGQVSGYMDVSRDITTAKLEQQELARSRHLIQQILEASPNIVYTFNLRTNQINYITPKIEPILGIHVSDVLHARNPFFFSLVDPKDLPLLIRRYNGLVNLREGEISEIEYRIKLNQKEWRWLKNRETAFSRDEKGRLLEVIGVCEDITLRKQAEENLFLRLNSEKLLSALSADFINLSSEAPDATLCETLKAVCDFIGADHAALFLANEGGLQARINCSAAAKSEGVFYPERVELSARLEDELRQQPIFVIHALENLTPEGRAVYEQALGQAAKPAVAVPILHGGLIYGLLIFSSNGAPLNWNPELEYLLLTFAQTLLKALIQNQSERQLQQSEARYRAIVEEHQTEMICRFARGGQMSFVNETFCNYHACDRASLLDTNFMDFVIGEDLPGLQEAMAGLSLENPAVTVNFRAQLKSGQVRWQEWVLRGISGPDGLMEEFQAVGRDISERKEMEKQIQTAHARLVQATRLASVGQLAASVAHQISNPLTTIIADAQMLLRVMKPNNPGYESTEAIVEAGWRAQQVISELLKFSQPADNRRELVYINETIEKALLLSTAHLHAGGAVLDLKLPEMSPEIHGNERQLVDLWVNLLLAPLNLDAGIPTVIHILASQSAAGSVTVKFINDGVRLPPESIQTLFEPQLVPAGGRGTGIEMSICREILRQHSGEISVNSDGTSITFEIILPKREAA